jgi:hypothetical protein
LFLFSLLGAEFGAELGVIAPSSAHLASDAGWGVACNLNGLRGSIG